MRQMKWDRLQLLDYSRKLRGFIPLNSGNYFCLAFNVYRKSKIFVHVSSRMYCMTDATAHGILDPATDRHRNDVFVDVQR